MAFLLLSLADPAERSAPAKPLPPSDYPLDLLRGHHDAPSSRRIAAIATASLLTHVLLFLIAIQLPSFFKASQPERYVVVHHVPLYMPRELMTQRSPNQGKVSKQIDLASLLAEQQRQRAQQATPNPSVRHFELPKEIAARQLTKSSPKILPDAPSPSVTPDPGAGMVGGLPSAPPPSAPKPSLLAAAGADAPSNAHPKIASPKAPVQSAVNELSRGAGQNPSITDNIQSLPTPPTPGLNDQSGSQHARIELESDAQGADFRDYLRRLLAKVRYNQSRTAPARLRGRTVIEVIIKRDGAIAKSSIIEPSGYAQLDLAAMAALSMSNPLDNLPADYKGFQVRLTLTFTYNLPQ